MYVLVISFSFHIRNFLGIQNNGYIDSFTIVERRRVMKRYSEYGVQSYVAVIESYILLPNIADKQRLTKHHPNTAPAFKGMP